MQLAYLTSTYPKASHTFIRRELRALEERGHSIVRLAIRSPGDALVDPQDHEELARTFTCLDQSRARLGRDLLRVSLTRPRRAWRALRHAWQLYRRAGGGLLRHVAYWIEACSLLCALRGRGVEHLHVHFGTNPATVALLLRSLGGPPFSMTVHGPHEFDAPEALALDRKVAESAFTVAISDYAASQLRRWCAYEDWERIEIVRCTVADHFFADPPPIPREAPAHVVCVGRLTPAKGQLLLLDAVASLADQGCELRVTLAGDGEQRPLVEQRIHALGLGDHVAVTGWIDEAQVRKLLCASRGLVLPSFAEGLPVVIMEALALGRPVISTQVAAIPELVRTGVTGWLIPPGNVSELAGALHELATSDASALEALGRNGRALVRQRHRAATEVERLDQLITRSLET